LDLKTWGSGCQTFQDARRKPKTGIGSDRPREGREPKVESDKRESQVVSVKRGRFGHSAGVGKTSWVAGEAKRQERDEKMGRAPKN